MKHYIPFILGCFLGLIVAWHYTPKDCVEYKIHNPLENYDPITLKEKK